VPKLLFSLLKAAKKKEAKKKVPCYASNIGSRTLIELAGLLEIAID
jgi:hypothetical protein